MRHYELVVVGAGPGGLAAAVHASEAGMQVAVFDEGLQAGGQYYCRPQVPTGGGQAPTDLSPVIDRFLKARLEYHPGSVVWGVYGDRLLAISDGGKSDLVKADQIVVATGAYERPICFPGWTLPGVMAAGGAGRLAKSQKIPPAGRVVLAGSGPFLLPVAVELLNAGARVLGVYEAASKCDWLRLLSVGWRYVDNVTEAIGYFRALLAARTPLGYGWVVTAARGDGRVEEVVLAKTDADWRPRPGTEQTLPADALCVGYGFLPDSELTRLLGCEHNVDALTDGLVCTHDEWMQTTVPGVYVAGETAGVGGARVAELEGEIAGTAAALQVGHLTTAQAEGRLRGARRRLEHRRRFAAAMNRIFAPRPGLYQLATDNTVVCRCEDITLAELHKAVPPWPASGNLVKAWSRAGMGMCQGRICGSLVPHLISLHGASLDGVFTVRAPIRPIPISSLLQMPPDSLAAERG